MKNSSGSSYQCQRNDGSDGSELCQPKPGPSLPPMCVHIMIAIIDNFLYPIFVALRIWHFPKDCFPKDWHPDKLSKKQDIFLLCLKQMLIEIFYKVWQKDVSYKVVWTSENHLTLPDNLISKVPFCSPNYLIPKQVFSSQKCVWICVC